MTAYALEKLQKIPGIAIYGTAAERSGIISFTLDSIHPHDLAQFADTRGIALRAGHHCAQPLLRRLGVPALARISFYFYNTCQDIDTLIETLVNAQEYFS